MGSREDDDWFNVKYAEAACYEHAADYMHYDEDEGEWVCTECTYDDKRAANEEAYLYG